MSSDIRRRETKTVPRFQGIEAVKDPLVRRVLYDVYDHLPKDLVTFDDLEGLGASISTTVQTSPQFYDRGDPATSDWDEGDLTLDNNWHTLDLTTVNAAIAEAVEVKLRVTFASGSGHLYVRRNGNSNTINEDGQIYESGDPQSAFTLLVSPDENGYIEYRGTTSGGTIDLTVAGWWQGYGSSGTGASSEIALNSAHRLGDGTDHAHVALNDAHRAGDGTDHSAIATNHPHQAVDTADSPTFAGATLTGLAGVLKATAGVVAGSATTTDLTEGTNLYFTEARANAASDVVLAKAHISADGSSHSKVATHDGYLNQAVKTTSSPTFAGLTLTPLSGVLKATAGVVGGSADSDDVDEGATNLYFTEARANAASDVVAAKAHITADGGSHSHIASNHPHQAVDTADAPTFGGVTSTGQLVVQTATNLPLSSHGEAAGSNVDYYYANNAAAAAANSVGYHLRVRSSTAMRTAGNLRASLPTTTDASRTGRLEMLVPDNGSIASRLAVEGKIVRAENGGLLTVLPSNGAPSTTPEAGSLYFDTGTNKLMVYAGGTWVAVH